MFNSSPNTIISLPQGWHLFVTTPHHSLAPSHSHPHSPPFRSLSHAYTKTPLQQQRTVSSFINFVVVVVVGGGGGDDGGVVPNIARTTDVFHAGKTYLPTVYIQVMWRREEKNKTQFNKHACCYRNHNTHYVYTAALTGFSFGTLPLSYRDKLHGQTITFPW